ncbi:hypothetical protein [Persephonella sp.]
MSFKEFKEFKPHRFKDFNDAKKYIENTELDPELTQEAVDYMIAHNEFHYLLSTIVDKFYEKGGSKQFFDYLFSKLSDCPKRKTDFDLYVKILESPNKTLKDTFIAYLKSCADKITPFVMEMLHSKEPEKRKTAVCILRYIPSENTNKVILDLIDTEKDLNVMEEILNYLSLYLLKEEKDHLEKIKNAFPELEDKINRILNNL